MTDTGEFKIEPAIPIPPGTWGNRSRFPLHQMRIGDSFFVLDATSKPETVRNAASQFHKAHPEFHFVTRRMHDSADRKGTRVWRVAAEIAEKETPKPEIGLSESNPAQHPTAK